MEYIHVCVNDPQLMSVNNNRLGTKFIVVGCNHSITDHDDPKVARCVLCGLTVDELNELVWGDVTE